MRITLEFWNQLREAARTGSELVEVDEGGDLRSLLRAVADRHGEPLRSLLLDADGAPRAALILGRDGALAPWRRRRPARWRGGGADAAGGGRLRWTTRPTRPTCPD